jgi:hypothetical protein
MLDAKFKQAGLGAVLSLAFNSSSNESRKLEEIVAQAKASVEKGDGKACLFSERPKTGSGTGVGRKGDEDKIEALKKEMEAAAKKKEEERKDRARKRKIKS